MIRLDIFSDPVCPWCLIGKARLDRALENRPDHPFAIEWHPFQLNPAMPPEGVDRADHLEAVFGSQKAAAQAMARVDEAARESGVEIDWAAIRRIPNTFDAHRLIHWAGLEGRQTPMVSALFRAYWREGRDIGDRATLAAIAEESGLDAEAIAQLLESDADAEAIRIREAHARSRGISAVPTFIVADRHAVPGAQPTELWLQIIDEIAGQP